MTLHFEICVNKDSQNSLVGANRLSGETATFVDTDMDGNELYEIETDIDISRELDLSDGVIMYHAKRIWDSEDIERMFGTLESDTTGYVTFIPLFDENAKDWGVDVVTLKHDKQYAFRNTNPMNDGDWNIGDFDDIANELLIMEDSWYTFTMNGENMKFRNEAHG